MKTYGLIPKALPADHPTTHMVFGSAALSDIQDVLGLPDVVGPTDQGDTNFCTCYTTRQLASDIDGVVYDENWNVAMTGEMEGAPITNGAPALDAMNALIMKGSLALADAPQGMTWEEKGPAFVADWRNWPLPLAQKAAQHEQMAVLGVEGPYDAFDNVRAYITAHRRHVAFATKWYQEFNEANPSGCIPMPDFSSTVFSWHMYEAMDLDVVNGEPVIRMKPHEGKDYGKDGYVYFNRDVVNNLFKEPLATKVTYKEIPADVFARLLEQRDVFKADALTMLFNYLTKNL